MYAISFCFAEDSRADHLSDVATKNPIVFCHGLLGFDTVTLGPSIAPLQVTHWRGIRDALEANGSEVRPLITARSLRFSDHMDYASRSGPHHARARDELAHRPRKGALCEDRGDVPRARGASHRYVPLRASLLACSCGLQDDLDTGHSMVRLLSLPPSPTDITLSFPVLTAL